MIKKIFPCVVKSAQLEQELAPIPEYCPQLHATGPAWTPVQ